MQAFTKKMVDGVLVTSELRLHPLAVMSISGNNAKFG